MQNIEYLNKFKSALDAFSPLSDAAWNIFSSGLSVKTYAKNEVLQHAGDPAEFGWFVLSGLVRIFATSDEGEEINFGFFEEEGMACSYASFLRQTPAEQSIQAIEETVCLRFKMDVINPLLRDFNEWNVILRRIIEMHFLWLYDRALLLLMADAPTRLKHFQKTFPKLFERLSQRHLACYLGISREALNRIMKSERSQLKKQLI